MDKLIAALKVSLANTYLMYFRAHSYHWNVEGMNFSEFHSFFGSIYTEVYDAIDPLAEHIRSADVNSYAPFSLLSLTEFSTITEDTAKPKDVHEMVGKLIEANDFVIESLNEAFKQAVSEDKQGLANYLSERIDAHAKHGWQLKATLK